MDIVDQMAADIAMKMNGGEWTDGKWYSQGHRDAWVKAVQPYADEIVKLREALLDAAYAALKESVYGALVMQTRLKPYLDQINLSIGESGMLAVNDENWRRVV